MDVSSCVPGWHVVALPLLKAMEVSARVMHSFMCAPTSLYLFTTYRAVLLVLQAQIMPLYDAFCEM